MKSTNKISRLTVFLTSFLLFFLLFENIYKVVSTPVGWEKEFQLTDDKIEVISFHNARKGNLVAAAIYGKRDGKSGIFSMISFDGGRSFFKPEMIARLEDSEAQPIVHPRIALSGDGHISVVWQYYEGEEFHYRIYGASSSDKGANWNSARILLSPGEMEILPQNFYDDRNRLHLLYHSMEKDKISIYHSIETASQKGSTFSKPDLVSQSEAEIRGAFFPAIAYREKTIYVVWQGKENKSSLTDDLYFTFSENYGQKWSPSKKITYEESNDSSPSLLIKDNELYLVYLNDGSTNWQLYMQRAIQLGEFWDEKPILISKTNVNSFQPQIKLMPDKSLTAFWYQPAENEKMKLYSSTFKEESQSFSPPQSISEDQESIKQPCVTTNESELSALWINTGKIMGVRNDIYTKPPRVSSHTHPYGKWSPFGTAEIEWKEPDDISGIAGYATILNDQKYFDPTVQNIDAGATSTNVPFLRDGISYFHIRAIDKAGNYSRTIHYPLLVSASQLSIPKVTSSTHPESKPSDARNLEIEWSIEDSERIAGYYYTLSRDSAQIPEKKTENTSLVINNLKDGRYFFTVRGVDKTGSEGKIATYELIVGDAKKLDSKDYEKIAKDLEHDEKTFTKEKSDTVVATNFETDGSHSTLYSEDEVGPLFPELDLELFINRENISQKGTLVFTLQLKKELIPDIKTRSFNYTVYRDNEKVREGTSDNGNIKLNGLPEGDYSITAKAIYVYNDDPDQIKRHTRQIEVETLIKSPAAIPVDLFYERIFSGFIRDWKLNSVFILSLTSSLFFSLIFFRLYYSFRSQVIRLIQRLLLLFQS